MLEKSVIKHEELPACFKQVTDEIIIFTGDEKQNKVRLISFTVAGSYFRLMTNRFDLTTLSGHYHLRVWLADRVIFQVCEAHDERNSFAESQSKRRGNPVLCPDDGGDFDAEVKTSKSKVEKGSGKRSGKKSDCESKKQRKIKKSVKMDQRYCQSFLQIVENIKGLADCGQEFISASS